MVIVSGAVILILAGSVVGVSILIMDRNSLMMGAISSYESGFMSSSSELVPISVRFFSVVVVFLLLDLETATILTTPPSLGEIFGVMGLSVGLIVWVYVLLTVYEWGIGALDWAD
uniref:NADH-ubiquinone oxidoreductase chain 3 n=1 Tax=Plagiorhynchus transversus TaxID=1795586 RepID=A0A140E9M7_9BILA|nr:NADH dehydrogenase subunit 3 [Plagiorhynchus transversus]AMK97078.1 NADH dehydrogenase subunit 3 [Plagiorhynchus transversus]